MCPDNITYEDDQEEQHEFDVDYHVPDFNSLYEFADRKQVRRWVQKWREMLMLNQNDSVVKEWFANLRKVHGPHVVGNAKCTLKFDLLRTTWENLPKRGRFVRHGDILDDCPPTGPM